MTKDETELPFWKTAEFLEERDLWYQVLEDDGFEDIEYWFPGRPNLENPPLKSYASSHHARYYNASVEEYFRAASQYYWEATFSSPFHDKTWELYAVSGFRPLEITEELYPSSGRHSGPYFRVFRALDKIRKSQEFRSYLERNANIPPYIVEDI